MNEKIKELAEQAGLDMTYPHCIDGDIDDLERFAELVEEEERKECAKQYLEITRDAVKKAILKEREACAKACQAIGKHELITMCATAIRGRTE